MAETKQIVILGGSYSGVSIAHYLLKHAIPKLPTTTTYQVVLVSSASKVMCRPACPRALISDEFFAKDKLFVSIPGVFEQYPKGSFRFVHGTVTELDHANRTVSINVVGGEDEKIAFHALVIATGASTPSPLLGLNGGDVTALQDIWAQFRKALPEAKNIVICGGGPAGVETAGELGEYLNGKPGWFGSKSSKPKVAITIFTADSKILPALRPALASKAEEYLSRVGVTVVKNVRVKSVAPEAAGTTDVASKAAVTQEDGTIVEADLYIPAMGMRPNTSFLSKDLLTPSGHVSTNAATLRVDLAGPRIYAVGDVASTARPAVHLILNAIPVLGANIKRDLLLDAGVEESAVGDDRVYKIDTSETQLVPIGKSKGVGAVMGWSLPNFLIWAIKGRDYWLWTTGGLWSGKQWSKES